MRKLKICLISTDPTFLGGGSIVVRELINYLKNKKLELGITCVYKGKKEREYSKGEIIFKEIREKGIYPLNEIYFNIKLKKFIKNRSFDIVNSHGDYGFWLFFYRKKKDQKIIHTYHGSTFYFYKNHFKRFGLLKKILLSPILLFFYFIAKVPMKKVDKIICVSDKVKNELEKLYGKGKNITVVRTGVDTKKFKKRNKLKIRKKLRLEKDKIYGLYVGRGGFWTKGLDRVIKLSKEIYKLNKNYRLIVIGPDSGKVGHLIKENFIIFLPVISRKELPFYYNISDIFFCLSRYEGFPLVILEAIASKCLIICSKDIKHDIIKDHRNGLIFSGDYKKDSERILDLLKAEKNLKKIKNKAKKDIVELSIKKWGERYLKEMLNTIKKTDSKI